MKFSPVILAACAVIAFAPVQANAKVKCSRNADILQGSMIVLNDKGEWCETESDQRTAFNSRIDANYKAEVMAERKAERAYQIAMAKHMGTPIGAITGMLSMLGSGMSNYADKAGSAVPEAN
jgi:hypothetical protein